MTLLSIILDHIANHCSTSTPSYHSIKESIQLLRTKSTEEEWTNMTNSKFHNDCIECGLIFLLAMKELDPKEQLSGRMSTLPHIKPSCSLECSTVTIKLMEYLKESFDFDFKKQSRYSDREYKIDILYWCAKLGHLPLIRLLVKNGLLPRETSWLDWVMDRPSSIAFEEKHFQAVREMCRGDYSFLVDDYRDEIGSGRLCNCLERVQYKPAEYWDFIVEEYLCGNISISMLERIMSEWEMNSEEFLFSKQRIWIQKRGISNFVQKADVRFQFK